MGVLEKLETQLNVWLNKQAPVKLPPSGRKSLAGAMWWIALVFGVLQLWAVWALWHLGHFVDQIVTYNNNVAATYGYVVPATVHLGLFYWISLLVLAASAVLLLLAAPKLKQMQKGGWDLLFYSMLLYVVYVVGRLFDSVGSGFGDFFGGAIGAVLSVFFLFQVRDYFAGAKAAHAAPATPHHSAKK